ncbi:hypothetical protein [Pyxidicoccus xibeiensis]|uniref:hypothetical protein n=1 Tax=Pyxidicoccus xibeiensis TaxID=2906759 RepID=UPI0020A77DFA|nr:hypothetical protein [Pyxidicoccus xibeiensis]MCP3142965.1 hypothetical protein [Pyxidicoccus xibeiensis]
MSQTQATPAPESDGDCQFPLGYDGVLRIRAAPHLVLTPRPQSQPTLLGLEDWQVMVGGGCENLAGNVPCRLEWIVRGDSFAEKRLMHRRETCLVPNGDSFLVREKNGEGTQPLKVAVFELGLLGTGSLGFRVEPLLFGNQGFEVKPGAPASIPFDLAARIDFGLALEELSFGWLPDFIERNVRNHRVGSVMQLKPDFSPLFNGLVATVDIYPTPVEGVPPDKSATVHVEWEIGSPEATQEQLWRIGYLAVRDEKGEVLDNRLAALGNMESSETLSFQYQLSVSKKPPAPPPPPPEPPKGKKAGKKPPPPPPPPPVEQMKADPRLALVVPRPRLKTFAVSLDGGKLAVRGEFENFSDSVMLDLTVKPYVRVPQGDGWRVEELDDHFRNLLESNRKQASFPLRHTEKQFAAVNVCLPDDVSTLLSELETVSVSLEKGAFERELLDLKRLPRHYVEVLEQARGLQVFAAMRPTPVAGPREVPFWALADYEASEPGGSSGFAAFEGGMFVSRVLATGVCTANTVDLSGTVARLISPMPVVPPELQEEFTLFVSTICGEAIGQSEPAWKGVAHTIMNRVARKYEIWAECLTPTEIIKRTGFDGHSHPNADHARAYLKSPATASLLYRDKVARLINAVTPIYMRMAGNNCGDVVFFYSPEAQKALHKKDSKKYTSEIPAFVEQDPGGRKELVEITSKVLGDVKHDFKFYAFKRPEQNRRMTLEELEQAKAKRVAKKA